MAKHRRDFLGVERVIVQVALDHRLGAERQRGAGGALTFSGVAEIFAERRGDERQAGFGKPARRRWCHVGQQSTPCVARRVAPASLPGLAAATRRAVQASVRPMRLTMASRGMCSTSCSNVESKRSV